METEMRQHAYLRPHYRWSVEEGELLTLDSWPAFAVAMTGELAAVLFNGASTATANGDSLSQILSGLLVNALNSHRLLSTRDDRSPERFDTVTFMLAILEASGDPVGSPVTVMKEWLQAARDLDRALEDIGSWWYQWCQQAQLDTTEKGGEDLKPSNSYILGIKTSRGYEFAWSVWPTAEQAEAAGLESAKDGDVVEYRVQPAEVFRLEGYRGWAAGLYQSSGGSYQATMFWLVLEEHPNYEPDEEWLWRHQMTLSGRSRRPDLAWARLISEVIEYDVTHFPKAPASLYQLPLAVLARAGFGFPQEARQRLRDWQQTVEVAQSAYSRLAEVLRNR